MTELLLANALRAALLGLGVGLVAPLVRRPAVRHALWALVLASLFVPGVVPVPALPAFAPADLGGVERPLERETAELAAAVRAGDDTAGVPASAGAIVADVAPAWRGGALSVARLGRLAVGLWLAGSLAAALIAAARGRRFGRVVAAARPAPTVLIDRTSRLAARLGLARPPRVVVVDARVSPAVWGVGPWTRVLLPASLVERLDADALEPLLAHELAHVRRGDPWLRWLELAATIVFWWHPVTWWARTGLREAEERACDALVVTTLPARRADYARALVDTVAFLAGDPVPLPSTAPGAADPARLEERLTMIVRNDSVSGIGRPWGAALAVLAVIALAVAPAVGRPGGDTVDPGPVTLAPARVDAGGDAAPGPSREEIDELHRLRLQELELETALRKLRVERELLERRVHERVRDERLVAEELEAERLAAAGHEREAAHLRRALDAERRRAEIERRLAEEHGEIEVSMSRLRHELEVLHVKAEERELAGDAAAAAELQLRAEDLEVEMRRLQIEAERRELERYERLRALEREHGGDRPL